MSRVGRTVATLALLCALLSACTPVTVVVDNGGLPDEPFADDRVGPAIVVAQGDGPAGPYRAFVYRTDDGSTCFEIGAPGMGSAGCGPGEDGATGIGQYDGPEGGWFVGGGTRVPATEAVVRLADDTEVRTPVVLAPPGVTTGIRYFVVGVAADPVEYTLLDDAGTVLEQRDL